MPASIVCGFVVYNTPSHQPPATSHQPPATSHQPPHSLQTGQVGQPYLIALQSLIVKDRAIPLVTELHREGLPLATTTQRKGSRIPPLDDSHEARLSRPYSQARKVGNPNPHQCTAQTIENHIQALAFSRYRFANPRSTKAPKGSTFKSLLASSQENHSPLLANSQREPNTTPLCFAQVRKLTTASHSSKTRRARLHTPQPSKPHTGQNRSL